MGWGKVELTVSRVRPEVRPPSTRPGSLILAGGAPFAGILFSAAVSYRVKGRRHMIQLFTKSLGAATAGTLLVLALAAAEPAPAARGRELFEKRCTGCHSLDRTKTGPVLRSVFGRRAAADPNFPYSDALRNAKLTWNEDTLNRWLADPDRLVPDNDMSVRLDNAADRDAIVAYLKQLAPQRPGQ
jgi:cytochrome c